MSETTGREKRFSDRIEFAQLSPPTPDRGVVAPWSMLVKLPMLLGWSVETRQPYAARGAIRCRWYFRRDAGEQITLDVVVGPNSQFSREYLLTDLGNTMAVEIPGALIRPPLGDVGVCYPESRPGFVAWVFLNVYAKLKWASGGDSVLLLAREMQTWMERCVVNNYSLYQPSVMLLSCRPTTLAVGEMAMVECDVAASSMAMAADIVKVEMQSAFNHLVLDHVDGTNWYWRAVRSGVAALEVFLFHEETRVSVRRELDITVQ